MVLKPFEKTLTGQLPNCPKNVGKYKEMFKTTNHFLENYTTPMLELQEPKLEAPGVKERKLAGWGLSRGKAWKGSLNVTEKKKRAPNGSQHGHHGGRAHDETFFFMLYLKAIKATQMEW